MKRYFMKLLCLHPKYMIPLAAIVFLVLFGVFECVRARLYLSTVNEYKQSVEVQKFLDTVERLHKNAESYPQSYYCNIDLPTSTKQLAETLSKEAAIQLDEISEAPAYATLLVFLPRPQEARRVSQELRWSTNSLEELLGSDDRSRYCVELANVLQVAGFVVDLSEPQGVSALQPGQLDSFQRKTTMVIEKLKTMSFPDVFKAQHEQLFVTLNHLKIHLQANDNDYVGFSRTIAADADEIRDILLSLRQNLTDLQESLRYYFSRITTSQLLAKKHTICDKL